MTNPNAKLFDLFQAEKERHTPDMTLFYRKGNDRQDASMRYISEKEGQEGVLTVLFPKNGEELFYFKHKDEKGIGELVQRIVDDGKFGELKEGFHNMPNVFKTIAQDYQYNREALHIADELKDSVQPKKTKPVERE